MVQRIVILLSLFGVGLALLFADSQYPDVSLQKGYVTAFAAAICYLLLKLLLDELVIRRVRTAKTRYSLRKTTATLFLVMLTVVVLRIWLPNAQALLVSYGLIGAGVAISLQDVFKNLVGGIVIFANGTYRVGDRIEINGTFGDVIDIGMFYTSLLEIRGWVAGDQATGRIVTIPNGLVLPQNVNNYTKDHSFIWDEITLPITYRSNWEKAVNLIRDVVTKETQEITQAAERQLSSLQEKYYMSQRNVEPDVFLMPTDNWIAFHIRYIAPVRDRRLLHNTLVQQILKTVQAHADITIASTTMEIVGLPEVNVTHPTANG